MNTSLVKTDEYNRLCVGGIHDATIKAFNFVADDRFNLCLRSQAGHDQWISLHGLSQIGFSDLVNGAIVSDIYCWRVSDTTAQDLRLQAWRVLLGGNFVERDLPDLVLKLSARKGSSLLVSVECCYGGSIAALCSRLAIEPVARQGS